MNNNHSKSFIVNKGASVDRRIGRDIDSRLPLGKNFVLSLQGLLCCFSATVLVPIICGMDIANALLGAGLGTLSFVIITKGEVPMYLGSSFAFIAANLNAMQHGPEYVAGGTIVVGVTYLAISMLIRVIGIRRFRRFLPAEVIGPVIITIGISLAPIASNMVMTGNGGIGPGHTDFTAAYSLVNLGIGFATIAIIILVMIKAKNFFSALPVLSGIVGGYLLALLVGVTAGRSVIDFSSIQTAAFVQIPNFYLPAFQLNLLLPYIIVSLAAVAEHTGDISICGTICEKDFFLRPGLHRTVAGDGAATIISGLFGGPANVSYGEWLGQMTLTGYRNIRIVIGAAVLAVLFAFLGWLSGFIVSIPTPVIGGASFMLFGIIAASGPRLMLKEGVDFSSIRTLALFSIIIVLGIGGLVIKFDADSADGFSGVALAIVVGVILNAVWPDRKREVEEQKSEKQET